MTDNKNIIDGSGAMFDKIAPKYDLLNMLTSLGQDRKWRKEAVKAIAAEKGRVLDLAAGTCDVSIKIALTYSNIKVIAADPSINMLKEGKKKIDLQKLNSKIAPCLVAGEMLPFVDESFDAATIAFGIRNFQNRTASLFEIYRILKKESRLVILELGTPQKGLMGKLASFYSTVFIPFIGGLISNKEQYTYLPRSMQQFPLPDRFSKELETAGFKIINIQSFAFGICTLFVCKKASLI